MPENFKVNLTIHLMEVLLQKTKLYIYDKSREWFDNLEGGLNSLAPF